MNITLAHQSVPHDAPPDERDVLDQAAAIREALTGLGHTVSTLPCDTDLGNVRRKLEVLKPACVFNLVETLEGSAQLIHLAPATWEKAGVAFTGSSAEALYLTTHKLLAKERLRSAGLPVPDWVAGTPPDAPCAAEPGDWIVKSVWEHASIGLDDTSVLRGLTPGEVRQRLPPGAFAERFIDGREFNLALLAGPHGPQNLPPAEIVFEDFPAGKPRIVGYRAKWDAASFEYAHTVRRFAEAPSDAPLTAELARLARRCWEVFALGGYARVDFRVDALGRPWILEVNANPCLAPDSGFAAALAQAGIPYAAALERIVRDACGTAAPPEAGRTPPRAAGAAPADVTFRHEATPADIAAVREVTAATGYFSDSEADVAVELVEERLAKGAASGYEFVFAECAGRVVGYTSFGPVPCTQSSFDWYWLAVRPDLQNAGIGRRLLAEVERRSRESGGTRLFCETSARPQYASTRSFYERMGFALCEVLEDFYGPGDGRATYVKTL